MLLTSGIYPIPTPGVVRFYTCDIPNYKATSLLEKRVREIDLIS
jgi:hypothetical protein